MSSPPPFLSHLSINRNVSASTQRVALNSLAFLYNRFLEKPIGDMQDFRRSKRQAKLPIVLTKEEMKVLISHLERPYKLIAALLYGSGLRRIECVRLRVKIVIKK